MDGKELKKRRLEKGLGQQQLARLSGVSRREICKAENGRLLKLGGKQSASLLAALRRSS